MPETRIVYSNKNMNPSVTEIATVMHFNNGYTASALKTGPLPICSLVYYKTIRETDAAGPFGLFTLGEQEASDDEVAEFFAMVSKLPPIKDD